MTHFIGEIIVPDGVRERNKRLVLLGLLALVGAGLGYFLFSKISSHSIKYELLKTASVRYGEVSDMVGGYGNMAPKTAQALTATQGGTITYLAIQPGQTVKKGDVLAKLVNRDLNQRLDEARKNYIAGKSEVSSEAYASEKQLLDLHVTRDNLVGEIKNQAIKVDAEEMLSSKGVVSKMAYMQDQAQLDSLKRQLRATNKELASLESMTEAQRTLNREKLDFLEEQVKSREKDVERLIIRAPRDGAIYKVPDDLVVGRTLQPGGEIASFIEVSNLQAVFQINAIDAPSIKIGMPVKITVGGREIAGTVSRIDPNVVQDQVKVVADIDQRNLSGVLPGQPINATVLRKTIANALYVDAWAGAPPGGAQDVYKINDDKKSLKKVRVTFGNRVGSSILIENGLRVGDRVVIGGLPASVDRETVFLD